ncbi:MAG: DUF4147 domain-containing protein [Gemmatimonadales bacterium]|nr:DUF4147 domain-containing protein [Gemmatimonadales bacterium]
MTTPADDRTLLEQLYRAAVAAVDPGPATTEAIARLTTTSDAPLWILALGKASVPMATAASRHARADGRRIAGGVIVAPELGHTPDASLPLVRGDHPEPGGASLAAATLLGQVVERIGPGDEVWVLLSGGATSLIGAPRDPVAPDDLRQLYARLLASGLDIGAMNRIRKRFTRWGGGKLAAALAGRRVLQLVVSDVIGDDLPSIGSGPCVADATTAREIEELLQRAGLLHEVAASIRGVLDATVAGTIPETPKPGDRAFETVRTAIISSNRLALEAAARKATELGLVPMLVAEPIRGEARAVGASVVASLRNNSQATGSQVAARPCMIWGGETTVTLGSAPGLGGRCQELALAAAEALRDGPRLSVLAAGTDGRDGPTDAAGAIVDGGTWSRIVNAGRDPAHDLERHDAYPALSAANALLKPGLTGTNVMDVVFGLG